MLRIRSSVRMALGALAFLSAMGASHAGPFYEGKTVRIIQPFGNGGAFDTIARLVSRHLGKHLPGKPDYVVESMRGAGGLIAINYIYNIAKPDGLTVGFLIADSLVGELLGSNGVKFESEKLIWLGAPSFATPVCVFTASSGIKTIDDWRNAKTPPKIGSIAAGGDLSYSIPRLLGTQAGLPSQIIVGHEGGNPALKLAAERGEIAGFCNSLESATILWGDALSNGTVNVVVQMGREPDPKIPHVPHIKTLTKTPEGADLIKIAVSNPQSINRAFAFPPRTPDNIVAMFRKALAETLADQEFLEEAKKLRVNINPIAGETISKTVAEIRSATPGQTQVLKDLLSAAQ